MKIVIICLIILSGTIAHAEPIVMKYDIRPNGQSNIYDFNFLQDGNRVSWQQWSIDLQSSVSSILDVFSQGKLLNLSDRNLSGKVQSFYENGELFYELEFKNSILHGFSTVYSIDGSIKSKCVWNNGSLSPGKECLESKAPTREILRKNGRTSIILRDGSGNLMSEAQHIP